jgi:hypothetical protein
MQARDAQLVAFGDMEGMVQTYMRRHISPSLTHSLSLSLSLSLSPSLASYDSQTDATYRALCEYSTSRLGSGVLFASDADMVVVYTPEAYDQICSYYADNYC